MRIISGSAGGRRLVALPGRNTRPTADRVKEAIFSVLMADIPDSRVLDAFAGSGALGLEALSRGAKNALFIEKERSAGDIVVANMRACGFGNAKLVRGDTLRLLPKLKTQNPDLCFDLIFADPPYAAGLLPPLMELVQKNALLAENGIFIAETAKKTPFVPEAPWEEYKTSTYGDTVVHYCRLL